MRAKQYAKRVLSMAAAAVLTVTSLSVFTPAKAEQAEVVPQYPFMDTSLSFEERTADLVSRMTLEEKVSQLGRNTAAIPRLGVAKYDYWNEALHGIQNGTGEGTSFPQPFSLAQTWDVELIEEVASAIADEARGHNQPLEEGGRGRGLTYWCPTINLMRSPIWGRTSEGYGEDAYVSGILASAFVNGMQGDPEKNGGYLKTASTMKHYALNNHENDRGSTSSDASEKDIRDYYTRVFRYVVDNSDVSTVMSAYNAVNGVPSSANEFLLTTLLRETYGFTGSVVSDCGAIGNIADQHKWNPSSAGITTIQGQPITDDYLNEDGSVTTPGSVAIALMAGCDMDCGEVYPANAKKAYDQGLITEGQIEKNVYNNLLLRFKLGEFDPDEMVTYRSDAYSFDNIVETDEHRALAEKAANESGVLLKNEGNILPLNVNDLTKIVVVGDLVDVCELGNYSGHPQEKNLISVYDGISDYLFTHNKEVQLDKVTKFDEQGNFSEEDTALIEAADVVIVMGSDTHDDSSEGHDREAMVLTRNQNQMISNVGKLNENTVLYLQTSNLVELGTFQNDVDAILWSCQNGQAQGVGVANQLFGDVNPSGKLTFTWYADEDQVPGIRQYGLSEAYGDEEEPYTNGGFTYQYFTGDVSYPFGYGLSYTTYQYSNMTVSKDAADANETLTVTVDVENTGDRAGSEVVQLYVVYPDAEANGLPAKQIKGFAKVDLEAKEKKTVSIDLDLSDCYFWDEEAEKNVVPTGTYTIVAAASSDEEEANKLTKNVTVSGALADELNVLTATPSGVSIDMADADAAITTELTLTKKDDSFMDLDAEDLTISYESDNTSVATVDNAGKVTGVGAGVATITVTAEYNGSKVTSSYPVAVKSGVKATTLTVDGQSVENFDAETLTYNVSVADGQVPTVAATAESGVDVDVKAAQAVPGQTTVTLTKDSQSVVYTVNFVDACDITAITFEGAKLTTEQAANYTLNAQATLATCEQAGHQDKAVTYTYAVLENDTNTATAEIDGTTLKVTGEGRVTVKVTASYNGATETATAQFWVTDAVDRNQLEEAIRVKLTGDDFDPETLEAYYAQLELAREVFFKEDATQDEIDQAYDDLMAVKEKLVDRTYLVANFPEANTTYSLNNDKNIYVDWKKARDADNQEVTVDFTTHKPEKLELRFTVTLTPSDWSVPFSSVLSGGSWIKLRSTDEANKAEDPDLIMGGGSMASNSEHNYAWAIKNYITDWGTTEVVIPLMDEETGALPLVDRSHKPDGTNNTSRGSIDWSEIDRFFMILTTNKTYTNAGLSVSAKLENVRVVDTTLEEEREILQAMLDENVAVEDCTDAAKVQAYQEAYTEAQEAIQGENVLRIMNANEALTAAREALGVAITVNKTALQTAIDNQVTDLDRYTEASVTEYKARIAAAQAVLDKADATQLEVNRALAALENVDSILQLIKVTPYVIATLQEGEKAVENHYLAVAASAPGGSVDLTAEKDYTVTVQYQIKLESTHAQTPSNNDWLKYIVNGKARVWTDTPDGNNNAIDIATMDCSKNSVMTAYTTPGEWLTVTQELPVEVLEDGKLTQFEVFIYNDTHNYTTSPDADINWNKDTGVKMTVKDIVIMSDRPTNIEPQPADKEALQAAITAAEAVDTSLYTEDSVAAFTDALEAAQTVNADADATQTEVDNALKALTDAQAALVPVARAYGDVSGDGDVTAEDALLALQAATDKVDLDDAALAAANVNTDEDVTAEDALLILQYAVEKIDVFPIEQE